MASTPVTTPTGADPFAGSPTDPNAAPPGTPSPVGTAAATGMPTFVGGSAKSKTTFGVPNDQFATGIYDPGLRQPRLQAEQGIPGGSSRPLYAEGDQWAPKNWADADSVRALQVELVNAGILSSKAVHFGVWDKVSADAYAKILGQANLEGHTASAVVKEYGSSVLPTAAITPSDLKAIANQAAQQFLGRDLDAGELAQFETAFTTGIAGGGPTTAPGTASLAGDIITKQEGGEVRSRGLHQVSQRALQMLSQPAVNLPSPQ